MVMVFNAIFNHISVTCGGQFFIGAGNRSTRRKPPTQVDGFLWVLQLNTITLTPAHGEVYLIQLYVKKFVNDLPQVDGFLWVLQLNTITLTPAQNTPRHEQGLGLWCLTGVPRGNHQPVANH
jgi:hypothetical protein